MAGNSWGADVAQLRALAHEFGITSDALLRQSAAPGPAINHPASWQGADVARLKSAWNSSRRALIRKTALALAQESKNLLEDANEQEKAGSAAGSTASRRGLALGGTLPGGVAKLNSALAVRARPGATPAGTVCQVASAGIAVHNNRDIIGCAPKDAGDGVANARKDPCTFVGASADAVEQAGTSVDKFLGFALRRHP
jgi:hypothetical protein